MSTLCPLAYLAVGSPHLARPRRQPRTNAMNRFILAALLGLITTETNARGGSCSSGACNGTAVFVLVVLLLAFVVSLYDSIRNLGFICGMLTNRAALFVFGYLGMLVVSVGGSFAAAELWGDSAAIWYLGSLAIAALVLPRVFSKYKPRPSSTSHPISDKGSK